MRNRHVLITGGSSGIGLALAQRCAADGAFVSLIARDSSKLAVAAEAVRAASKSPDAARVFTSSADVADEASLAAAIRAAEAALGCVDMLVTSAGVARPGYFSEQPMSVHQETMAVNYFGTLHAIRAVAPGMRERRNGSIVIVSSGAGLVGLFGYTSYSPSKFALRGLAESLRAELKPDGVNVTIVYPPDTDTPQLAEENRAKPRETRALTSVAGLWSADAVARSILHGVRLGRFSITPGFQLTALSCLHSLIAPILRWSFDRIVAKNRD